MCKRKQYKCETCYREYEKLSSLLTHQYYAHRANEIDRDAYTICKSSKQQKNSYICDICFEFCFSEKGIQKHKEFHSKQNKFICNLCGFRYKYESDLKKHIKKHKKHKFTCNICNKMLLQSYLNTHKRFHTGEKPHVCKECNEKFTTKAELRKHTIIHENHRLFFCDSCKLLFDELQDFEEHTLLHPAGKPHACNKCDLSFFTGNQLTAHVISRHNI